LNVRKQFLIREDEKSNLGNDWRLKYSLISSQRD